MERLGMILILKTKMCRPLFEEFREIDTGSLIDAVFDKNEKRLRHKLKGTLAGAFVFFSKIDNSLIQKMSQKCE